ncbi:MAG TPA: DNA gyrase modulator, partial [Thermodesulfobacteriota bacterium]|nr:DNA gyrase modulator [Thermodesulfobacteriota bacterium]
MRGAGVSPERLHALLDVARRAGATAGDALLVEAVRAEAVVRLGEVERVVQARERQLGLRLFAGRRSASAATADLSDEGLDRLIADTLALARAAAEDPAAGLPD